MCTDIDIENTSIEQVLQSLELNIETYLQSLKVSQHGTSVILKQNIQDVFVNASNSDILSLWGGNMDLQIVTDEIAAVMYLCNYLTKGEKAMGETLKHVAKECRNDDIHTQMKKIKKEFLGKRTLASPETAMRVLSMLFMKKSRKVTSVNTDMQEEHISVPKNYEQLSQLDDDDDDNVFATSIID